MHSLFRLAHISDLHFAKLSWNPSQFFSKRWIGNLNLFLSRSRAYSPDHLYHLLSVFLEKEIEYVLITGDLTTTSLKEEFEAAHDFISTLEKAGLKVLILPGNHDKYTRSACKEDLFHQFFDTQFSQRVCKTKVSHQWWLVGLDTAIATSLLSSRGEFSIEVESSLRKTLTDIPSGDSIILSNHFPFFNNDSSRKTLKRREVLKEIIQEFPNIRLYLHGHTHRHCIADLRPSGLPLILDSGSTAHKEKGSWNFIDMTQEGCAIQPFHWKKNSWTPSSLHSYKW